MTHCEHCGSAIAASESVCPACGQPVGSSLTAQSPWIPPDDVGGVEFASSHTWKVRRQLTDAAVEAAIWRVRGAFAAVLFLAGANLWLGFAQGLVIDVLGGVVLAVLLFFIARKSLIALLTAGALQGTISLWLILTGRVTLTLAIAIRVLILMAIFQAVGPMQLLRARDGATSNPMPRDS